MGAAPIPFTIPVDPTRLDPYASYTMFAYLDAPGRLSWLSDERPVLTWGEPTRVELALQPPAESLLLSGGVTVPEPSALPPDAVVSVQVAYIYKGTIGFTAYEHQITPVKALPIRYAIEYTQHSFQPSETYALSASVRLRERLLFTSLLVPVNPAAMPSTVDLHL